MRNERDVCVCVCVCCDSGIGERREGVWSSCIYTEFKLVKVSLIDAQLPPAKFAL